MFGGGGAEFGFDFLNLLGVGALMGDTIDVLMDFSFASSLWLETNSIL